MTAGKPVPVLRVVGAVWRRRGRVFLAQRPKGTNHQGLWEFPGGKQELGERSKAALAREAVEELGAAMAHHGPIVGSIHDLIFFY